MSERAYVAAGSNLGRREDNLAAARARLAALPGVESLVASTAHDTPPLGPAGQPRYLNQVFALDTTLEPRALLDALLAIERALGRERREKWGPRVIDLDLVLYGDRVLDESGLTIPHPEMHRRRFVLAPLAELAPDARHPVLGKSVKALLEALPADAP